MKILIDTNVVLDAIAQREPFREAAEQILLLAAEGKTKAYITANSATDIYYLIRKHLPSAAKAKEQLLKLTCAIGILDIAERDCLNGFSSPVHDYEDAVLSVRAKRAKMDYIVTRDMKHLEKASVPILSPEAFIKACADL
ncbi:MAG: PIN domain-containing protein [Clostridiales Family XIII bacterium]|jgi:predicted nucleic acid-binding protein|nr:PIN domain-containing protein [Clostridiales Family XIII bacterium]